MCTLDNFIDRCEQFDNPKRTKVITNWFNYNNYNYNWSFWTHPHEFSYAHLGGDISHLNGLLCLCHFLTLAWLLQLNFFAKSPLKTLQESNWFFCLSFHARSVYLESRYEHLNESAKMIFFQSTEKTKKITNRGYNRCLVLLLNAGWHPNTG